LLAALLLLLGVAPFTEIGTAQMVRLVDRFTPFDLEYGGGRLGSEFHLHYLSLTTEDIELHLENVRAHIIPACLWRSALCFAQLDVQALTLDVLPSEEDGESQSPADPEPKELLDLPVAAETDSLRVGSAIIRWPTGRWEQGSLQAAVHIGGHSIDVLHAVVQGALLGLDGDSAEERGQPLSLPSIDLPLQLSVDDLQLHSPSFEVSGTKQQFDRLQLKGRWRNRDLQLQELVIEAPEWPDLKASGGLRFEEDWPLDLAAELRFPEKVQWQNLPGHIVSTKLSGDLKQLEVIAAASGELEFSLGGTVQLLQPDLPFEITLESHWKDRLPLADLLALSGPLEELELISPATLHTRGTLLQQSFELRGGAAGLGYEELAIELTGAQGEGVLYVENLSLLDKEKLNTLHASGELSLAPQPHWSFTIESGGMDLPKLSDYAVGRLAGRLELSGKASDSAWQLSIGNTDLRGEVNGLPALVSGYAALDSELKIGASDLVGEVNGARFLLSSRGQAGEQGQLSLSIDDLGRWVSGGRGSIVFDASLAGISSEVRFKGSLDSVELAGLSLERGKLSGFYQPDQEQQFLLDALISEVALQGVELDSVHLRAGGDAAQQRVTLDARGDYQGQLSLAGAFAGENWRGLLSSSAVQSPQGIWQLDKAAPLTWSARDGKLTLAGHCWLNGRTDVCPGQFQLAGRGTGSLKVTGEMDFLAGLFPDEVDISGEINLEAEVAWGAGEPLVLNGRSDSRDVRITRHFGVGEQATVTWERAEVALEQREQGLYLAGNMIADDLRKFSITVLLPEDRETGVLEGELDFDRLQLATIAPLIPELSTLEGEVQGKVQLGGSINKPVARGNIGLKGGRIALPGNPTELESLDLSVDVQGDRAMVSGSGLLGGGEVSMQGSLLFAPELRLEMAVSGDKHQLLFLPSTELLVSENLQLVATPGLLDVSGEVLVHEGTLRHEELPEGSVAVSSHVVVVDYMGNVIQEERPFDTRLNVWVRLEDKFLVEGGGLRATLGGDLHVVQEPSQPLQLFGSLNVIGGELTAYRQRLNIKRGTISFAGTPGNPEFNVRAEREIRGDNITVGVELLGTLESPEMNVYSDPVLEHSEAMSYLVRGRGLDSGAAADGTALALSMGADVVNQSGVLSGLDRIPLINQVQFGSEGSADDTAATVSGYIGDRIYIAYGIGIYEPITVLTVRLYFSARMWLEVVSRLENSVDLYYSFDIH